MSYQERQEMYLERIERLQAEIDAASTPEVRREKQITLEEEETAWAEFQADFNVL